MIVDTIENSMDRPEIKMSDETYAAMMELRRFMFENVYMSNVAKREEKKAKNIIEMLFETFLRDPMKLPEDDRNMVEEMGVERVVCDYIAGMTANYAIYQFNELFVPKGWSIR